MLVRLYSGQIQGGQPIEQGSPTPAQIDRACMLCYEGVFQSMDGEVKITADHLRKFAETHNTRIALLAAAYQGDIPNREYPPLQLDHSKLATHTIGRVVGVLGVEPRLVDGTSKLALVGSVRFLGADNVEKANDGRYSNVSIGADLATGILSELSVTPFPAAPHASLLSRGSHMTDKEKLKKHLMKTAKCSAEEAEKKLAEMPEDDQKKLAAEVDEEEKKLAAEEDEKAKKLAAEEDEKKKDLAHQEPDGDEGEKKLTAARPKIVQLMGEAKESIRLAKIEARKSEISIRLSKLRAQAKLSPAEEKVLLKEITLSAGKTVRLAEATDDSLALVWAVLEAREPVIHVGQLGTVKPLDLSDAGKTVKGVRLAAEAKATLSNMPFTAKMMAKTAGTEETETVRPADAVRETETVTETHVESASTIEEQQKQLAAFQEQLAKLSAITIALAEVIA